MKSGLLFLALATAGMAGLPPALASNAVSGSVQMPARTLEGGGPGFLLIDLQGTDAGGSQQTAYTANGMVYANFLTGVLAFNAAAHNATTAFTLDLSAEFQIQGPPTGAGTVPVTFEFALRGTAAVNAATAGYSFAALTAGMHSQLRTPLAPLHTAGYDYRWSIDARGALPDEQWQHEGNGTVIVRHESPGAFDVVLRTTEALPVLTDGRSSFVDLGYRLQGSGGGVYANGVLGGLNAAQLSVLLPAGYGIAPGIPFLTSAVPEPASAVLALLGAVGLAGVVWRRRQACG